MYARPPRKVLIETEVGESPLVRALKSRLPSARFNMTDRIPAGGKHDPDLLEVVAFRGRFLKSCPGTRHYLCCGYRILHFGVQCSIGCSYCILQAYLNQPNLRLFGNTEALFREVSDELDANPDTLYRIGTGEFTDSLLLDPFTGFSSQLISFFARKSNAVLELKTKTDFIENLAERDHGGRVIVAWSLNAEEVRRREEPNAATLRQRLEAARRCARWGYGLAFHFDPMVEHDRWREGYGKTLDMLFDTVDPAQIVWISLGAFRFMPELKTAIRLGHPASRVICGEFIRGLDDKMRYFRDIRVELYSFMAERIRAADPGLCTYLCMEGEDIWRDALGFSPEERGGLPSMLDEAVGTRMRIHLQPRRSTWEDPGKEKFGARRGL